MDRYLFYMYLEYLKENKLTFWPKLLKQPKVVILLIIAIVISGIISVVISLVDINQYLSLVAVGAECLFCVLLYIYTENYMISSSVNV